MVKKIRVIDEPVDETETKQPTMSDFYELAKTMDWKLWEIMQSIQRLEKKLQLTDDSDSDGPTIISNKK
jgi:hypothetical protein